MAKDKDSIPAGATFYIRLLSGNIDGTFDLRGEATVGGLKIADALLPTQEDVAQYGLSGYVYECRPIFKVTRPNIKVIDMRKKKA